MTEYYTYWSLSDLASNRINPTLTSFIIAFIFLIAFGLLLKFKQSINYDNKTPLIIGTLLIGIGGLVFGSYLIINPLKKNDPYEVLVKRDLISEVEGVIFNFNTERILTRGGNRTVESFSIRDVDFQYDDYPASKVSKFTKTQANGGVLKNGLIAKIMYLKENNEIVKIQLKKTVHNTK